ncbi:hypothetical protein TRFO_39803 [Tritrichomonas foetus]|uniref:LMBR1-like conserved region family protein n=1 Tax=Tritrichomonas foetus TaxID=1144522 RepID=A0A1J4J3U5_9EUKA|nr:hypothetical protein TRFO_39803 [Tritrichomonas foetus]|eukprot:OHS94034.1 hypothetical protein TRFO_39803 [Tritrichomonas foetus]
MAVNKWAETLRTEGAELKKDVLKYGRNHRKVRKRLALFENQVNSLENTYSLIQVAYKLRGGNPIKYWISLALGIIAIIISIVWILQICICYIANAHPFLNTFFDILDRGFPYAAVIFFGFFVYYLYWCVLDGTTSVGINILIIRIHPMEKHNTPMTSMLFNSAVMLFASFGIALFSSMNFSIYQRLTSLEMIYGVQMQTLAGLKYVWQYGTYVFLGFIAIALAWKCVTLKKKDKRLKIIKKSFGAYNVKKLNPAKKKKKVKKVKMDNKDLDSVETVEDSVDEMKKSKKDSD